MIRAIIFDLDGTILNTIVTIAHFVNQTLQKYNISPITEEECKRFIGDGARKLIERSLESKGALTEELLDNLIIIACKAHIILLIHGLQLSVEATNNGIFEALRLNLSPILNLV